VSFHILFLAYRLAWIPDVMQPEGAGKKYKKQEEEEEYEHDLILYSYLRHSPVVRGKYLRERKKKTAQMGDLQLQQCKSNIINKFWRKRIM
jgi:hypothetical protein